MCYGLPLYGQTLSALAVQRGRAGHGRSAQGGGNLGTVARLADFSRGGAAVVGGVHVDAQLREETTHGYVAIEHTVRKRHILGCRQDVTERAQREYDAIRADT